MKNIIFFILYSLVLPGIIFSQPIQQWISIEPNLTYEREMKLDYLGNVFVCYESDIVIFKYSPSGNVLWSKSYSPGFPRDLEVDRFGNAIIIGSTGYSNQDSLVLLKYSNGGELLWQSYYADSLLKTDGLSCAVDDIGNIYITGYTSANSVSVMLTIKFDPSGNLLWVSKFRGPLAADDGRDLVIDKHGNVYSGGRSKGAGTSKDFILVKYNQNGVEQWNRRWNGPTGNRDDLLDFVNIDSSGNIYVAGVTYNLDLSFGFSVIKYTDNGNQQWVKIPRVFNNSVAYGCKIDKNGNLYLTGGCSPQTGILQLFAMKYNSNGDSLWTSTFPRNDYSIGEDIDIDSYGNCYISGWTIVNSGQGIYFALTLKYDGNGQFKWFREYSHPQIRDSRWKDICVDSMGSSIYSTGRLFPNNVATIKYSDIVSVHSFSNSNISNYVIHQNYPNPFNPKTKISYELRAAGDVKLSVFELTGKHITDLVNRRQDAGKYDIDFSAEGLASGVYFYKLCLTDVSAPLSILFSETKKMVLIK